MSLPNGCVSYTTLNEIFTIAASVATGLEAQCLNEIEEKLYDKKCQTNAWTAQGRVFFNIHSSQLQKIHKLRTVDNLFLLVKEFSNYEYNIDREVAIADIMELPSSINWKEVENFWRQNLLHSKKKVPHRTKKDQTSADELSSEDKSVHLNEVRYRVSANRVGKSQSITSIDAEQRFGGALQDISQWKVDLSNYNLEVFVNLALTSVQVYLALTLESLHRRNIVTFGQTTLRATIASCMLRMCRVLPGEVIIDPMCGTGAIPVEGCVSDYTSYYIGGDLYKKPLLKTRDNFHCNRIEDRFQLKCDTVQWDVTNLPLKTDSIDVVVTDMPFGKRVGTKADNRILYPKTIKELARICKKGTGRACLLSNDKRTMQNSIQTFSELWKVEGQTMINIGGLKAGVFLLKRTKNDF